MGLEQYGNEKIILGADVKKNKISVNGWKEESQQQLIPFLKDYTKEGVFKVLCTDISRDGMLQGPSVELYQQILKEFPDMHLIASGGVSCIQDIIDLEIAKVPAVVFGKALYEGKITLKDLKPFHVRTNYVSKKNHTLPGHQRRADRKRNQFRKLTSSR